jgi:hypothetical protein
MPRFHSLNVLPEEQRVFFMAHFRYFASNPIGKEAKVIPIADVSLFFIVGFKE